MSDQTVRGPKLVTGKPHSARMYDFLLGGRDNFRADRLAVDEVLRHQPYARAAALANRAFMHRVVRHLAAEAGVRQFLDIGTGIPTSPNLHEIAQGIDPACRVVYVDNDPLVIAHAAALLTSICEDRTAFVEADLGRPESILAASELCGTLDLDAPVALMLMSVLHFVPADDPYAIVGRLLKALPRGSYLALSHTTDELSPEETHRTVEIYNSRGVFVRHRGRAEIEAFFDGLEMVEPGVVPLPRWRPGIAGSPEVPDAQVPIYGGLARKVR